MCVTFQRSGTCKFGSKCKFSHDLGTRAPSQRQGLPKEDATPEQQQVRRFEIITYLATHNSYLWILYAAN
jgi:hypothetical protein